MALETEQKGIDLWYSPRILPDDLDNDDPNDTKKQHEKVLKRFINSIVREEKEKFNELLDVVDLNGVGARWPPLIWAIQKNRLWAIHQIFATNRIIDFKKQIDHKGKRTVLHFAAERGNLELVTLFLAKDKKQQISANFHSLDINAIDREHCTALFRAAKVGDEQVVEYLLKDGADPNITNNDGMIFIEMYPLYPRTFKCISTTKAFLPY